MFFEPSASSIDEWKGMETAFRLQDLNQQQRVSFPQIQSRSIFSLSSTRWEKMGWNGTVLWIFTKHVRFQILKGKNKQTHKQTNREFFWI